MELNRAPGGFWDAIIRIAIKMSRDSAEEARQLLAAGFPGPAYVCAARSIEIFVKEVILLPASSSKSRARTTSSTECSSKHAKRSTTHSTPDGGTPDCARRKRPSARSPRC